MNIAEAINVFFSEFQFPKGSKNTRRTYKTALTKFQDYAKEIKIHTRAISSFDPSIINLFGAWLVAKGLTEYTQSIYESALRRAINFWRIKG